MTNKEKATDYMRLFFRSLPTEIQQEFNDDPALGVCYALSLLDINVLHRVQDKILAPCVSTEKEAIIVGLFACGQTIKQITDLSNTSACTVIQTLKKNKYPLPSNCPECLSSFLLCNVSKDTHRLHQLLSDEQVHEVLSEISAGNTMGIYALPEFFADNDIQLVMRNEGIYEIWTMWQSGNTIREISDAFLDSLLVLRTLRWLGYPVSDWALGSSIDLITLQDIISLHRDKNSISEISSITGISEKLCKLVVKEYSKGRKLLN